MTEMRTESIQCHQSLDKISWKKKVFKAPRQLNNRSPRQKIAEETNTEIILLVFFSSCCTAGRNKSFQPTIRTLHNEIFPYNFLLNNFPLISTPTKFGLLFLQYVSVRMGLKHYEEWDQVVGNGKLVSPALNNSRFSTQHPGFYFAPPSNIFDGLPETEQRSQPPPTFHPHFSSQNYHCMYFSLSRVANHNQKDSKFKKKSPGCLGARLTVIK